MSARAGKWSWRSVSLLYLLQINASVFIADRSQNLGELREDICRIVVSCSWAHLQFEAVTTRVDVEVSVGAIVGVIGRKQAPSRMPKV